MKKGLLIGAVTVGLLYLAATPYIALHQMKAALEARDGQALAEYIDFPSVRQSAKDQFNAAAAKTFASGDGNGLEATGAALAGFMADKMIDAVVTPAGLTKLMDSGKRKGVLGDRLTNATSSYESWGKFVVVTSGDAKNQGKFVLRRQGLMTWKLTEFILPDSIFKHDAQSDTDAAAAAAADGEPAEVELPPSAVIASTTPANYSPLFSPNNIVTQGRCHMGECYWNKWLSATKLSGTSEETVISYSVLTGSSKHEEVEDYPSTSDDVDIAWDAEPSTVRVRCSHTRPSVTFNDADEQVIGLSPETGVFGYQEGSAAMYFMACHTDSSPRGLTASIEQYGYDIPAS